MKFFRAVFRLEFKRFWCKRNVLIFLVFFLLLLYFLQDGINNYHSILSNKDLFQETERTKVDQYVLYTQYGAYGIRLLFIPSPLSVVFNNSSVFNGLIAGVDSGERLNIYNNFKGKNLFAERSAGYMDFSGIIILLGCILALLYGFDALQNREYLKWLASFLGLRRFFFALLVSRVFLVGLLLVLLAGLSLAWMQVKGLSLFNVHFIYFILTAFLVLTFFLLVGALIGTLKNRTTGFIAIFSVYFIFIFLIPWTMSKIVYVRAGDIKSIYQLELEKLRIIMDFERKSFNEVGIYRSGDVAPQDIKRRIEKVLNNEYKKIYRLEDEMREDILRNIKRHHLITALIPTTFYTAVNYELSSSGYLNFLDYYVFSQERKRQFITFYVQKKFYSKSEPGKVETFIKGDENIYYAANRLPGNFGYGVLLNLLYIAVLSLLTFLRFKKSLYRRHRKRIPRLEALKFELEKGNCRVCHTSSSELKDQVYNFFPGKGQVFPGRISINGQEIAAGDMKRDFVYTCHPAHIPGEIKVKDLFTCLFAALDVTKAQQDRTREELIFEEIGNEHFSQLCHIDKVNILFAAARLKPAQVYLFNEIERDMDDVELECIAENVRELKKDNALLYLTRHLFFANKIADGNIVVARTTPVALT